MSLEHLTKVPSHHSSPPSVYFIGLLGFLPPGMRLPTHLSWSSSWSRAYISWLPIGVPLRRLPAAAEVSSFLDKASLLLSVLSSSERFLLANWLLDPRKGLLVCR